MVIRDDTEKYSRSGGRRHRNPAVEVRPGETLGGRFVVGEILGVGATGTVFSALDRTVGQKVAIKILHPDLHDDLTRERLRREVRASRNSHPNAVAVYDLHEADGHVFLSMELVEGRSLKDLLGERSKLDTSEVVNIGRQVADALTHLHDLGIIHRDIKPGNILLTPDGMIKLCDMGLARPMEEGMTVTETEMVVGTPAYMAPEQGIGSDLTSASDIYGLGLTLYQCLTGQVPLTSDTAVATLTRRQRERPPPVHRERPDCPTWLNRLIRRMLEPRSKDRPSASHVHRVLTSGKLWPRPRRRTIALAVAALVLVILGGVIGSRILISETVRVEVDQNSVFGIGSDGRKTWSFDAPEPPTFIERADLNGDGRQEVVLVGRNASNGELRSATASRSFVIVLEDNGDLVTRVVPEDLIGNWSFPYRLDVYPILSFEDLDADGWNEIIVNCRHNGFYPAVLLAYWPRWDAWDSLLHHPGSIITVGSASETGRPGLRFVAYNNLLGMTKVYGEIDLLPPDAERERYGRATVLQAPPGPMSANTTIGSWRAYVPFADGSATTYRDDHFVLDYEPDLIIGLTDRGPTFDAYYNPIEGPNRGIDLRSRRLRFMQSLNQLGKGNNTFTIGGVNDLLERIRFDAGPLMNERYYEVILSTLGAKALARAGDLDGAIAMLEKTRLRHHDDEVLHRLAHLLALHGDIDRARTTLIDAIDKGSTARSWFDVPMLFLQVAICHRNAEDVETSIMYLADRNPGTEGRPGLRNNLWARARLWWDESTAIDAEARTVDLDADGDAIASLVRWRLGTTAVDDSERIRASIKLNPDSFKLGTVALGAALISNGHPAEALAEIDHLISTLSHSATWDYSDAQILYLARAVRTVALEAAGDTVAAAISARVLASELDPDLLPGILVREVLDRTNS